MHASRVRCTAAAARATPAGIIESSSGSANIAPAPLRSARRERCRFVRKIIARCSSRGLQLDAETERIAEPQPLFRTVLQGRAHLRQLGAHRLAIKLLHLDG